MKEEVDPTDYGRLYERRFQSVAAGKKRAAWTVISRWIFDRLGRPACVLDPAAGALEFISTIPSADRWAIDMQPPADPSALSGITFLAGDTFEVPLPGSKFDAVFASNFLEHLDSPARVQEFLLKMREALKIGGRIACMGPNFKYCFREYFDCADHRLALTHVSVEEHLYAAGFELESCTPRFLPYSFRGSLPSNPGLVRWYLRLPWFWPFFGRQFLVIARRTT
ncbi:MAG: class I SAM-dependent methyltransferase [Planctomycetota bacterium]